MCCHRLTFARVSSTVLSHSKFRNELIFENFNRDFFGRTGGLGGRGEGEVGGSPEEEACALQKYLPMEKEITCPFWKPLGRNFSKVRSLCNRLSLDSCEMSIELTLGTIFQRAKCESSSKPSTGRFSIVSFVVI